MTKRNKNRGRPITKAAPQAMVKKSADMSRLRKNFYGSKGLAYYREIIELIMPFELRYPDNMRTFEAMKLDDAVGAVLNINYVMIEGAFSKFKVSYNKESEKSVRAGKFLEWCLNNMDNNQTFFQVIKNIETFKEKGFSIIEKGYTKITPKEHEEYAGLFKIRDLANRPQISLYSTQSNTPFEYLDGGNTIHSVLQDTTYFYNSTYSYRYLDPDYYDSFGYVRIPRNKFMLFGDNATDSNPMGSPILASCYKAWKEKQLIEDYETTGVAKDMAGIIKLTVPVDILQRAAEDPTSQEAAMIAQLQEDAANVHAGDQSYLITPSDLQEGSNTIKDYDTELMGIQGGGKQYKTTDIINQKRKAIFDTFGAGHILLGEGGGSYALMEGKNTLHAHYIRRDIKVIEDVLNFDLVRQLMRLNDFKLSDEDMPKIIAGPIEDISLDEISKMVQRIGAVGFLPKTPEVVNQILKKVGLDYEVDESLDPEAISELCGQPITRAGDGMSEGMSNGVGRSTAKGGDRSSGNSENNVTKGAIGIDAQGYYQLNKSGERVSISLSELPEDIRSVFS